MKSAWAAVVLTVLVTCATSAPQAIAQPAAHSYLGVELTDPPPQLGLQAAMVARVIADSPADQAGLRPGDLVRVVNGHVVPSAGALREYVISQNPGDRLIFNVLRETPSGIASLQLTAIFVRYHAYFPLQRWLLSFSGGTGFPAGQNDSLERACPEPVEGLSHYQTHARE